METYKTPNLLSINEEAKDASILVFFSSFGRVKGGLSVPQPSLTLEEYDWKSCISKPALYRLSTNGVASSVIRINPGQLYRFVIDASSSYSLTLLSKEDFYFEDESKILTEKYGVKVRDIEETSPAQPAGTWYMLFK